LVAGWQERTVRDNDDRFKTGNTPGKTETADIQTAPEIRKSTGNILANKKQGTEIG